MIRGQQVMLDFDLAEIYGYTTTRFNEQISHNISKFEGDDFMFVLTKEELGFCLFSNLTRRLALYQVSVRRFLNFATPFPPLLTSSPAACGSLRLAVNTRDRTFTG